MAVRFTEYLTHGERDIALYIVQEDIDVDKLGFKIFLKNEPGMVFGLYKEPGKIWQTLPHNVPQYIIDLRPQIIFLLEKHLIKLRRNAVESKASHR